jgi:hypothetical protein
VTVEESPQSWAPSTPRWRCVGTSVVGSSHERVGQSCQDASRTFVYRLPGNAEVLIVAIADGAGTAPLSEQGSRIACDAAIEVVSQFIEGGGELASIGEDMLHQWFDVCAERVGARAAVLEVDARELASTLLLAVVGPERALFAQVGDGAIVGEIDGAIQVVFWPQSGEFANTTLFLTSPADRADLLTRTHDGPVLELALLTDGLQALALEYAERRAHVPFFTPMLARLRELSPEAAEALAPSLADFLTSDLIRQRADDDLTLVLATRRAALAGAAVDSADPPPALPDQATRPRGGADE